MNRIFSIAIPLAVVLLVSISAPAPARAQGIADDVGGLTSVIRHWIQRNDDQITQDLYNTAFGSVACWFSIGENKYCLERDQQRLKACLGRSTTGLDYNCLLCPILASLTEPAMVFAQATGKNLSQLTQSFTSAVALLSLVLIAMRAAIQPGAGLQNFQDQFKQFGIILIVYTALSAAGNEWIRVAAIAPLETSLAVGTKLIEWMSPNAKMALFSYSPSPIALGTAASTVTPAFMALWSQIEVTIFPVTCLALDRMFGSSNAILYGEFFAGLFLAMPYVFVMGVFAAFLVQTLFYYVAMLCIMPLIFIALLMPQTRGLLMAMVKLLLTGALTILMASIAMALTSHIISLYATAMVEELLQQSSFSLAWNLSSFWSLVFVGFMSVILHLLAPRIAANIGGATDSAASAAGVVAAGQLAATKLLMKSREGFFGRGEQLGGLVGTPLASAGGRLANAFGTAVGGLGRFLKGGG